LKSSSFILVNKRKNATSRLKTFVSKNYIHYLMELLLKSMDKWRVYTIKPEAGCQAKK